MNDNGTMVQVAVTDLAAYFDDEITAMPNLTSVGTLTALQVDNININGNTIISSDTNGHINLTPNGSGNVVISSADINGGAIDATNITVGSGKTLDVSGGTLTLANDQISGNAINGGTIGSITITALAGDLGLGDNNITAVGSIALDSIQSASTGNGFDLTLLNNKADALEIKEGSNAYMTFITTTGSEEIQIDKALDINAVSDFGSNAMTNVNIDSGAIDSTTIGAGNPATGAFTTLTASDDVNFDSGTLFVDASGSSLGIGSTTPGTVNGTDRTGGGDTGILHLQGTVPRILFDDNGDVPQFAITAQDFFEVVKIPDDSSAESQLLKIESDGDTTFVGDLTIPEKIIHKDDTDTFIRFTDNQINFSAANATPMVLTSSQGQFADGSASAPSHSFLNDTNMGMYRAADNVLAFSTGGTQALKVSGSGVVFGEGDLVNAQFEMRKVNDGGGVNLAITNQAGGVSGSTNETTAVKFYHGKGGTTALGASFSEMANITVGRESTNQADSSTNALWLFIHSD